MLFPRDQEICFDAVNLLCKELPEVIVCEPVRVDSGWLPVFFAVENRRLRNGSTEEADYVMSAIQSSKAIVPFMLIRMGDVIYDWWLNLWGPYGWEILDGLIEAQEVPFFFISYTMGKVQLYPLEPSWKSFLEKVKETAKRFPPWTPRDVAVVKYSIMVQFPTKMAFWMDIFRGSPL